MLDLIQAGPIAHHSVDAIGTSDIAETAGSDLSSLPPASPANRA